LIRDQEALANNIAMDASLKHAREHEVPYNTAGCSQRLLNVSQMSFDENALYQAKACKVGNTEMTVLLTTTLHHQLDRAPSLLGSALNVGE